MTKHIRRVNPVIGARNFDVLHFFSDPKLSDLKPVAPIHYKLIHIPFNPHSSELARRNGFWFWLFCKFKSKHMCELARQVGAFGEGGNFCLSASKVKMEAKKNENLRQRPLQNVMLVNSSAWTAFCHDTETKNWRIRNILITNFQSHTLGLNLNGYRAGKAAFLVARIGDLAISLEIRSRPRAMESK